MFQRFHAMKERKESGFTLIELLVVILIIAILAAIAIPVFLNQRKKGWVSQQQSSLKNAATAMETIATEKNGSYASAAGQSCTLTCTATTATSLLDAYGYNGTTDVTLVVVSATAADFCLKAEHALITATPQYYDSETGNPTTAVCT